MQDLTALLDEQLNLSQHNLYACVSALAVKMFDCIRQLPEKKKPLLALLNDLYVVTPVEDVPAGRSSNAFVRRPKDSACTARFSPTA